MSYHVTDKTFGQPNSGFGNPYLFTARRFDEKTGVYYNRNRYFEPKSGRFVSRDPLGYVDGMNLYAAYFIPNRIDPSGMQSENREEEKKGDPLPIGWLFVAAILDEIKSTPEKLTECVVELGSALNPCAPSCTNNACKDCEVLIYITSVNYTPGAISAAEAIAPLAGAGQLPKTIGEAAISATSTYATKDLPNMANLYIHMMHFASARFSGAAIWYKVKQKKCEEVSCAWVSSKLDWVEHETDWKKYNDSTTQLMSLTSAFKKALKVKKELERKKCSSC